MGGELTKEAAELDREKMDQFLSQYEPWNENLFNVIDGTLYKKKYVMPSTSGHVNSVLMKRYVFKLQDESTRFAEVLKMRKSMPVQYLPKLYEYFMRIDNGYCQMFYTYHVAFEFISFNLEKVLAQRARNPPENKVAFSKHSISWRARSGTFSIRSRTLCAN